MQKDKRSSISKAKSYEEIGEFWDEHDLADFDNVVRKVEFDVDIQSQKTYCVIDNNISKQLDKLAKKRGVSINILVNLLLQEKLQG